LGSAVVIVIVVFLFHAVPGEPGVLQVWGIVSAGPDRSRFETAGQAGVVGRVRWCRRRRGAGCGPTSEVADAVEEFGAALADQLGEGPVVGAGVAQRGDGDVRQVAFVGLAESHRLVVIGQGRR
jgi:hypothetical protein